MSGSSRRPVSLSVLFSLLLTMLVFPASAAFASTAGTPGDSIAAVAAVAKPSVVGILTTIKATRSTDKGRAAGTGFAYKDGVIITNAHVVEGAQEVRILYSDKTVEVVLPEQIFADATSDVAVVKVTKKDLKPLPMANSDQVTVGQSVVAIGNPLGFRLSNTVTAGILSGTGRAIGSGYPFLQLDAPINPGNSGGPLFNLKGQVIGINSAKMAEFGVEGLGFAIPSNTAVSIAETLLKEGKVERAVLGLALDEGWEAYFGVPNAEGVTIANIVDDGPAGLTALRRGDKLVKLDETPIYSNDDVFSFLTTKNPGDVVTVSVKRSGQLLSAKITLASRDDMKTAVEEEVMEAPGILIDLNATQIQEAAEFGRDLAEGWGELSDEYFALSGNNYAILYTEYLYVARKISSAYSFGFTPSVGYQQRVADEIRKKIEVLMEINGEAPGFLDGATFELEQATVKREGKLHGLSYTSSPDGKIVIANAAVRFSTINLLPTEDVTVIVTTADKKRVSFQFTIKDLR